MSWKPKAKSKVDQLPLTPEEGFVLSRLDGQTNMQDLEHVTGLSAKRVSEIVDKLIGKGALDATLNGGGPPGFDDATLDDQPPVMSDPPPRRDEVTTTTRLPDADARTDVMSTPVHAAVSAELSAADLALDDEHDDSVAVDASENIEGTEERGDDEVPELEQANARKLYETLFANWDVAAREAHVRIANDHELLALCLDPHPGVIAALFDNSRAAFPHARLVARHHRTPQGLDVILSRHVLARDAHTQRLLLQNPMLQDAQLKRILQPKRLAEIYKVTLNRDIPERNRQKSRHVLRSKWAMSEGEERAGLVFSTEGRCLIQLTGLPFDSQTTAILCGKTYTSALLIQNLARFSATPPLLLSHLARQPLVKRQAHLRTAIKQHANCPSELKRALSS